MINTETAADRTDETEHAAVETIVSTGAPGAKMLAGLSTAVVIGLWVAFYFLVFVPRSVSP